MLKMFAIRLVIALFLMHDTLVDSLGSRANHVKTNLLWNALRLRGGADDTAARFTPKVLEQASDVTDNASSRRRYQQTRSESTQVEWVDELSKEIDRVCEQFNNTDFWVGPPKRSHQYLLNQMLWNASACGNESETLRLIRDGADVNSVDSEFLQTTALHRASLHGHGNIVDILLDHGANINFATIWRSTPLHYAVVRGHKDVVETLVVRGADMFLQDPIGHTALDRANLLQYKEISLYLHAMMQEKTGDKKSSNGSHV
mmetsp:Transcript_26616/g.87363  ORF Transcript_26616/g.87363 Transcript_26616/m.87363 type:complete len:259 (-) Transcript_26616:55-831(-)